LLADRVGQASCSATALAHLEPNLSTSCDLVDQGQLAFVGALFRPSSNWPGLENSIKTHAPAVVRTLRAGLDSPYAHSRSLACDVLASPCIALIQDGIGGGGLSPLDEAARLAGEGEGDVEVRAAASRALGFLVKTAALDPEVSFG